jgi:hypothetical protein
LAKCTCEAIWLRRLIRELGFAKNHPTTLWCDNQSSIKIEKNPVFHDKTKHFTRQKVENKTIKVDYIATTVQPADILTKALSRQKFETCRNKLNLRTVEEITKIVVSL